MKLYPKNSIHSDKSSNGPFFVKIALLIALSGIACNQPKNKEQNKGIESTASINKWQDIEKIVNTLNAENIILKDPEGFFTKFVKIYTDPSFQKFYEEENKNYETERGFIYTIPQEQKNRSIVQTYFLRNKGFYLFTDFEGAIIKGSICPTVGTPDTVILDDKKHTIPVYHTVTNNINFGTTDLGNNFITINPNPPTTTYYDVIKSNELGNANFNNEYLKYMGLKDTAFDSGSHGIVAVGMLSEFFSDKKSIQTEIRVMQQDSTRIASEIKRLVYLVAAAKPYFESKTRMPEGYIMYQMSIISFVSNFNGGPTNTPPLTLLAQQDPKFTEALDNYIETKGTQKHKEAKEKLDSIIDKIFTNNIQQREQLCEYIYNYYEKMRIFFKKFLDEKKAINIAKAKNK